MNIHQIIVFSILMQHGAGILSKSPTYIQEKMEAVMRDTHDPLALLDAEGQTLYARWYAEWHPESEKALKDVEIKPPA